MNKLLYIFPLCLLAAASCKKNDDFYNQLSKGAYLTLVKSNNTFLNAGDANSSVSITVSSVGSEVESVNLYVSADNTTDNTKWKLLSNTPFSGETTLTTTNKQIADALGLTPGALEPGAVFYLYNEVVTKDGRKFSTVNTSAADLESQPAFNISSVWNATVVCPYNAATIAGNYKVIQDDWQDRLPGDIVTVKAIGENQVDLSGVWPNPDAADPVDPFIISVDATTGAVTVPDDLVIGDYGIPVSTTAGSSGNVFSCTGRIDIVVHLIAPQPYGDLGLNHLVLEKQ